MARKSVKSSQPAEIKFLTWAINEGYVASYYHAPERIFKDYKRKKAKR